MLSYVSYLLAVASYSNIQIPELYQSFHVTLGKKANEHIPNRSNHCFKCNHLQLEKCPHIISPLRFLGPYRAAVQNVAILVHGAIVMVSIKDTETEERRGKKEEKNSCNQPSGPRHLMKCFAVTGLDWASQSLTVNCQLAAMSSQVCILDSPGGLLTLDLALIGWLRKFHKRIEPFMLFTKPRCGAFSFSALYSLVFICPLFSFTSSKTHATWGGVTTKVIPELSTSKPGGPSVVYRQDRDVVNSKPRQRINKNR